MTRECGTHEEAEALARSIDALARSISGRYKGKEGRTDAYWGCVLRRAAYYLDSKPAEHKPGQPRASREDEMPVMKVSGYSVWPESHLERTGPAPSKSTL